MSSSTFNDHHLKSNFSNLESIFQRRFVYAKNDAILRVKKRNPNIEILGNPEILILWQE